MKATISEDGESNSLFLNKQEKKTNEEKNDFILVQFSLVLFIY